MFLRHSCRVLAIAILALTVWSGRSLAQWVPGGTNVSGASTSNRVYIRADGFGGAMVAWNGNLYPTEYYGNPRLHRINALGVPDPAYPADGLRASMEQVEDQYLSNLLADGLGGWFVLWETFNNQTALDIHAQHILADGSIDPRWPVDGAPVCTTTGYQWHEHGVSDGAGSLFVVWDDERAVPHDVYAVKLDPSGVPAPGWPVDGRPLVTPSVQRVFDGFGVPDGLGGELLLWGESTGGHLLRIAGDGTPWPGWPTEGRIVSKTHVTESVAPDGSGGAYVSLANTLPSGVDSSYYLQHILPNGVIDPTWPVEGSPVCRAPVFRNSNMVFSDGLGGAFVEWLDYRFGYPRAFGLRMLANGTRAPGWAENGQPIFGLESFQNVPPDVVADGTGGVYVTSESERSDLPTTAMITHLSPDGSPSPGWSSQGTYLSPSAEAFPSMTSDGANGAIVAWVDRFNELVYAQHYEFGGIVATQLSLASSEVGADHVGLVWQGTGASDLDLHVERRDEGGGWRQIGTAVREAPDRVHYEDRDVIAGERYGYRVAWSEGGVDQWSAETWIDVPIAATFALEGLRPNPAVGQINVSFSLAHAGPATLELLDLAGRRIADREVGSLGAGRHTIRLDGRERVAPGVYWVRLRQDTQQAMTRAVVIR